MPRLANDTLQLFNKAPEPKQIVRDRLSYLDMSDEDRKTYENQIVNFFLQSIPPDFAAAITDAGAGKRRHVEDPL